jgi:filamentous hemagglutinin family protein
VVGSPARNLFHSFSQFNVQTGESATFTGPGSIASISSRVTGGQRSLIDRLID